MFLTIVKKELLANLLSLRFTISLLLCFVLILVSAYTMREKYETQVQEYSAAVKMRKEILEKATSIGELGGGYNLDKPPVPLSIIADGLDTIAGKVVTISIVGEPTLEGAVLKSDPMYGFFGTLDSVFIIKIVISLLAILFAYDAISGERERGTLKLILSNSVPRASVILSKWVGSYISLILPFIVSLLIGLLIIISSPYIAFSGEDWVRLGLIVLVSLIYIWFFSVVGLFVSVKTNKAATSIIVLLFVWVLFVLVIPKTTILLAKQIYRVPSVQEIQGQKDAVTQQALKEIMEHVKPDKMPEEIKSIKDPQERGKAFQDFMVKKQEEMIAKIEEKHGQIEGAYRDKRNRQIQIGMDLSRISPVSSYTYTTAALARTDFEHQETFVRAAKRYQMDFTRFYNEQVREIIKTGIQEAKLDLTGFPEFRFRQETLDESLTHVWIDIILLLLFSTTFFMLAVISFLRADVR